MTPGVLFCVLFALFFLFFLIIYFLFNMKPLKIGDLVARLPIVQGGMGVGISMSKLAAAVANEGGIGVISSAGLGVIYRDYSKDYNKASIYGLRQELRKAKEATKGIIGVNVMVALTNFVDMVKTSIEEKADIIFSGAGLPLSLPSLRPEGSKTKLAPIVSSARAAKLLCTKWKNEYNVLPDAIVVEGPKAGGHLGYKYEQIEDPDFALEKIVPEVVAQVRVFEEKYNATIPVIAGGGLYTGEDIYNIIEKGASGAQLGTRFVVTEECDADERFKQAYIDAKREDVEIIQSPVGLPGRAIHNSFLDKVKEGLKKPKVCPFDCIKTCNMVDSPYCIMLALYNAYLGRMDNGYAFAGANAWRSEKIMSVKKLMNELVDGFKACKDKISEIV